MSIAPRHYLLVDDNPTDRLLAQEAFAELQPDCTLTCVASGLEALDFLQVAVPLPDVILLDINMPGMNGFQLLERLKNRPELKGIPVVMLSTSNAAEDIRQAYTLHASSYVVKSPSFEAFMAQVEAFLGYWQATRVARPSTAEQP
ncbi:response regulator [Deinococcus deserti]|uniref:Putative response regulator, CheY n=1 Tax=Deinococcus deserti (strain DSM 17065 / CIP 109153 / LMG 22923 / VCD115) TaxID=546414 RepID=C1D475_DEIDV|nr:response regulator [Deinococcus deserti]ACO47956.1 putative response regulator, CheY [Deinococcus deserti VCD115]